MLILGFTAIDYGAAMRVESQMQRAADSATTAAVKLLGGERHLVESAARQDLDTALSDGLKGLPFELEIGPGQRSVEVRLETTVQTSVIVLAGIPSFRVRASSLAFAERPAARPREALPAALPPDIARTIDIDGVPGIEGRDGERLTPEEQEAMRRVSEEIERMVRDALSRRGR